MYSNARSGVSHSTRRWGATGIFQLFVRHPFQQCGRPDGICFTRAGRGMNQATISLPVGIPGFLLKRERLPFAVPKKFLRLSPCFVVGIFIGQNINPFKKAETAYPNRGL